jgi:hypothetical protein
MTKKLIISLIVLFTFGLIGCDNEDETDPSLNGTWVNGADKINFNSGNYIITERSVETIKGTYATNEKRINMQPTEMKYNGSSNFYSKETFIDARELLDLTEAQINEMFKQKTVTYFIDGNRLFIVNYLDNGVYDNTVIYTK